jgi:hypothetical protein
MVVAVDEMMMRAYTISKWYYLLPTPSCYLPISHNPTQQLSYTHKKLNV